MFLPVKQVSFHHENLEELIPTQILDESPEVSDSESSVDGGRTKDLAKDGIKGRSLPNGAEDGALTQGRRKRRRDWIWRPMEDDVLLSQPKVTVTRAVEDHILLSQAQAQAQAAETESHNTKATTPETRAATAEAEDHGTRYTISEPQVAVPEGAPEVGTPCTDVMQLESHDSPARAAAGEEAETSTAVSPSTI